ncbi:MAG: HEAT repeat domain-containing protein [Mariniblastus sp.]
MQSKLQIRILNLAILSATLFAVGCAEGPLWRAGKYSPWARNQWAEEERIADTLFARKQKMTELANSVVNAPVEDQQKVAQQLTDTLHSDPVLLLRLHSVKLLGTLNCPGAIQGLVDASYDHNSDIRIAAIKSWKAMPAETAIPQLQEIIGSDSNIDVRLAGTRALGNFSGQEAVRAISLALDDPDPALQLRAAESLQVVTGEQLGRNVVAWQEYVKNILPQETTPSTPTNDPLEAGFGNPSRVAELKTGGGFSPNNDRSESSDSFFR